MQDEFPGLHWLPEPEGSPLWHRLPFLWSHCRRARHILKEAGPSSAQITGHVRLHTSYYMKEVLGATEEGGNPQKWPLTQTC